MKIISVFRMFTVYYFGSKFDVPEFVNYIATNKDGGIFGYEREPVRGRRGEWENINGGNTLQVGIAELSDPLEWKSSLHYLKGGI